jgi:phosphoenolpyruvate synthase/pyruvate phosphate dikinase
VPVPETKNASPIVRPSDPQTSHAAAAAVQLGRCELIFLRSLHRCQPASAYEIAARQSEWPNHETIRKRAGGLKDSGMIRVIDRNATHPQTGNPVERFMLTGAGIQRIQGET